MADYEYSDKLVSEFNEAKFQIFRLDNLTRETGSLLEKGKLVPAIWKLDRYAIELWCDALRLDKDKKKDEDSYKDKLEKLDKKINEAVDNRNFRELYLSLMEKWKLLKEIQEDAGKGAKLRSTDDDFM